MMTQNHSTSNRSFIILCSMMNLGFASLASRLRIAETGVMVTQSQAMTGSI